MPRGLERLVDDAQNRSDGWERLGKALDLVVPAVTASVNTGDPRSGCKHVPASALPSPWLPGVNCTSCGRPWPPDLQAGLLQPEEFFGP